MEEFKKLLEDLSDESSIVLVENFLVNDLSVYLMHLDRIINEIKESQSEFDDVKFLFLKNQNDQIIKKGELILDKINNKVFAKKFKDEFRKLRPDFFYSSEIMEKGYKKYRGYPGDFEMMNYVYNNKLSSSDKVGKYFDKYFIQNAYAQAVRGRKNKMVSILKRIVEDFKGTQLDVLNLPCGPARDVKELLEDNSIRKDIPINIVCVDQDLGALDFSRKSIGWENKNINLIFKQGNILNYVRHPKEHQEELGQFDFVYSIGLADYLPDKMLQSMINFSWSLLKPNGSIIYAFKIEDKDPFAPLPPKWFCDWEFVPRNEKQALDVINNSNLGKFKILRSDWEETGKIVFYTIVKE